MLYIDNPLSPVHYPFHISQPVVVADFDGDGLNDIIFVTAEGVYG